MNYRRFINSSNHQWNEKPEIANDICPRPRTHTTPHKNMKFKERNTFYFLFLCFCFLFILDDFEGPLVDSLIRIITGCIRHSFDAMVFIFCFVLLKLFSFVGLQLQQWTFFFVFFLFVSLFHYFLEWDYFYDKHMNTNWLLFRLFHSSANVLHFMSYMHAHTHHSGRW